MTADELFEQLKHPNPHLRERAMDEIVETRNEETIPRLMENLNAEDVVYRRASVKTLGAIGTDAVSALVESLLTSDSPTVRSSCAKALAQVALNYPEVTFPEEGLQGLKAAMEDANPIVYIASAMALGEIGEPAMNVLTEALKTTDNPALAVSIANAFAAIGTEPAAEALRALADDESADSYARESAVSALSRLEMLRKNTYHPPES